MIAESPLNARPATAPESDSPRLSVVIATCANPARVERCLRSLSACAFTDWEAIVADNRPTGSPVRAAVAEMATNAQRVTALDVERRGLSAARNAGLAIARGGLVAFVDDDVVVDPAWMSAVVGAFEATGADCVTGKIVPESLETTGAQLFEQLAALDKGEEPTLFDRSSTETYGRLFPYAAGTFGSGASIAMRSAMARELGGFDLCLGAGTPATGGEDLDLFVRLIHAGGRIFYEPRATVYHEHPARLPHVRTRAFTYGLGLTAMLMGQFVHGPRRPLLAALPAGVRYLRDPSSRKNAARSEHYPRSLALLEWLGMALGPLAWVRSALLARRQPPLPLPAPAAAPAFVPTAAGAVDLEHPLPDLDFGRSSGGALYGSALILLRMHGEPLDTVEVPLEGGRIAAAELAARVSESALPALRRHAERHACLAAEAIDRTRLIAGLGTGCSERPVGGEEAPFVTVIVPTAGRPERIRPLVHSLSGLDYPRFEILIVDNRPGEGATRAEIEGCRAEGHPVRYAAEPLPGSSVARNRGAREARGDILAFTDDDVALDPGWLSWMVTPFVRDATVGVVTGLVMPARFDTPEQRFFEQLSGFGKGFERQVYSASTQPDPPRLLYPYWGAVFGSGNSMAFRRDVYEEIGGLDPALGAGSPARAGADIESFTHALVRGHRLVYEPRAVCWHDHRTSEAALQRQTFNYGIGCTAIFTKWLLRDPRLLSLALRQGAGLLRARRRSSGAGTAAMPHELERLAQQVAAHRGRGGARRQLAGFAIGPIMYARSLLWARRLKLRAVLPPTAR